MNQEPLQARVPNEPRYNLRSQKRQQILPRQPTNQEPLQQRILHEPGYNLRPRPEQCIINHRPKENEKTKMVEKLIDTITILIQ